MESDPMPGHPPSSLLDPRLPSPSQRLLVRGVNWLGDAVMTTPALQRLREAFPQAHITLLTPEKLADLWRHHPSVDATLTFATDEGPWSVARRLRAHQFQTALVLPNSPRSALEVWLARIPQRIGYARPWRNWLLTHPLPSRPGHTPMRKLSPRDVQRLIRGSANTRPSAPLPANAHQLQEYLHLVGALGARTAPVPPQLHLTASEPATVARRLELPQPAPALFGLNAGAEYGPAKRWPLEQFIAAAREIQKRTNCAWLILGGRADAPVAAEIESALRAPNAAVQNLAGQTTLRELMAVLQLCRVLLTNDTGPMHVAAALGTPVVVPFGSTTPALTGPGLPGDPRHRLLQSNAPCAPCFRRTCPIDLRCLTGIGVARVVAAVLEAEAFKRAALESG